MHRLAQIVACLVAACAGSCGDTHASFSSPPKRRKPHNIVLVVMDTVRADHVGCYGYPVRTTPGLDAFARQATVYERALSTSAWTLPSHASMFTGLLPHEHGAHTFWLEERRKNVAPLPGDVPVIAEALRDVGYRTAAFSANDIYLAPRWGLSRGFDTYVVEHAYARDHTRKVVEWLDRDLREPFFLFVNYMDAHRPYNIEPVPGFSPSLDPDRFLIERLKRSVMGGATPIPLDMKDRVIRQYDNGIRHIDEAISSLLLELDGRGLRDRSVIVVTSDHGEYFGEHRLVGHHMDVYQPATHVPLLVDSPGEEGAVDSTVVTSRHLPWLLRSRIQDERVRDALEPFAVEPGDGPILVENYYSTFSDVFSDTWGHRFRRVRRGLYEWPFKLIHSSDGAHELYDLASDPDEMTNLFGRDSERALRLVATVEQETAGERPHAVDTVLTEDEVNRMCALGYLE